MSGSFKIIGANRHVEFSVSASNDLTALSQEFFEEAVKLREACATGSSMKITANLNFSDPGGGAVVHEAERAQRNGVLHALRPFVLQKRERLFVPSFLNAFRKENPDPRATWLADHMRDAFLLRQAPFQLATNSVTLQFEQQWQHYANAFEYHRDTEKRQAIEAAFSPLPPMAEFVFWWGVSQKAQTVIAVGGFAAALSGQVPSFTLKMADDLP